MARTLEEQVLESMDALFRGALFLSAGDGDEAGTLLEDVALAAYYANRRSEPSSVVDGSGLEALLVRTYLAHGPAAPESRVSGLRPSPTDRVSADAVFHAAAAVPPRPRAALWLVLIRRWSYARAADLLGVDDAGFRDLLVWRDAFMAAVLGERRSPTTWSAG